jgi:hypothetical protein
MLTQSILPAPCTKSLPKAAKKLCVVLAMLKFLALISSQRVTKSGHSLGADSAAVHFFRGFNTPGLT